MSGPRVTVLLVEDNPGDARLIGLALAENAGPTIELVHADRLSTGLEALACGGIDVVLLDLSLPDSHGLETFERVRLEAPGVPVVVLSGSSDEQLAARAVNGGAQDYLVKGRADGEALERAIRYAIERHQNMTELQRLALVDELTGLRNRRGFITLGEHALKASDRSRAKLALVFVDMNDMKGINDRLGHHEGDRAIKDVADVLLMTFRDSDVVARIGGDEFCALIQIAQDFNEDVVVERIQQNLRDFECARQRQYRLALSVGVYLYDPEKPCSLEELMENADRLMYRQKMGGERRPHLLVVDDDASLRRLAEVIFGDGYEVTTAASASEATALAKDHLFDLVLLDVGLPDRRGTDLIRDMRSDPATSRTPIILLTGMDDDRVEVEGLRLGAADFVRKPFNEEVLLSRVANAIARARRR